MSVIQIPGYKIVRTLGVGGQATVYLAVQEGFDRQVALKVMSPALAADPSFGERFIREAKIVANLSHNNIVTVYDVGQSGNYYYLAMQYLPGADLKTRIMEGMKTKECLSIISTMARALNFAHRKGYIHRDVKSENILFDEEGKPLLTDFGIAKASNSSTQMTQTGKLIGTPEYMSPEQCRGKKIDGRSDLYSLGIILYEMLVRQVPFSGEDSVAVCIKHVTKPLPSLPARLNHMQWLIDGLLAKDADKRFQTGEELASAINEYSSGSLNTEEMHSRFEPSVTQEMQAFDDDEESVSGLSDFGDNTRPQISEIHPKSKLPIILVGLLLIAGIAGYFTHEKWYPQAYQWVQSKTGQQEKVTVAGAEKTTAEKSQANETQNNQPQQPPNVEKLLQQTDVLIQFTPRKVADYKQALKLIATAATLQPDNKNIALVQQNVLNTSLSEAVSLAQQNNFQQANEWIALVEYEQPEHQLLRVTKQNIENLQADYLSLQQQKTLEQGNIKEMLTKGNSALEQGRLSSPKEDNAIYYFEQVMMLEPENQQAQQGLLNVAERYAAMIETAIAENSYSKAKAYLEKYKKLSNDESNSLRLSQLISKQEIQYNQKLQERRRIAAEENQKKQQQQARLDKLNDPLVQLQLKGNLDTAKALEEQQMLVEPEENNALQKYRSALQIDELNPDAKAGVARIESTIINAIKSAIETNNKDEALKWLRKLQKFDEQHPQLEIYLQQVDQLSAQTEQQPDEEVTEEQLSEEQLLEEQLPEEQLPEEQSSEEQSSEEESPQQQPPQQEPVEEN